MLNFLRTFFYSHIQKWRRTLLLILLAAISIFSGLRAAESIKAYNYLIQLGLNPHPLYFVISGGLIGLLFLIAFSARITKLAWSRRFIHFCAIFLGLLFIIEEVFISINKAGIFSIVIKLSLVAVLFLLPEKLKES
jgi:uncharacterized membrane protein